MLRLAIPVILSYLAIMLMGLVDLVFIGRVGPAEMGAVGVGLSFFSWFLIFGIGMLSGLDYLVSFAYGAGRPEEGRTAWRQGVWISLVIGPVGTLLLFALSSRLESFGVNAEVALHAGPYLRVLAVSLTPLYVFTACRQYLQARGGARLAMLVLFAANVLNAFLNWTLVWGNAGFPRLETVGSAWATTLSRLFMMFAALGAIAYMGHDGARAAQAHWLDRAMLKNLLKIGAPAALQMVFEVGAFAVATLLAARLTPVDLAAHQIVLNVASLTFMVPLGLGAATSVLVGQSLGSQQFTRAKSLGWRALGGGCAFMTASCLMMLLLPEQLLSLYTNNPDVVLRGSMLFVIAGLFQVADGAQVVATGALRGLGDTRTAAIANFGGHWFVGLPIGIWLTFSRGLGLKGLWIGLSLGLVSVAVSLVVAWALKSKRLESLPKAA